MKCHSKDIINAANKYGFLDLKLAAEACLIRTTVFSVENLLNRFMYADSKNFPLLTKVEIDFMLENKDEVIKKVSFNDAPRALVSDAVLAE